MRRLLAILLIGPLTGCGAHLHRPLDDQLARSAATEIEALDWDEAFALDRGQRDAIAKREAELGRAYADARREAELLDILTEPVGERSWTKLEDRLVELAACMLAEPGTHGGRACRGRVDDAQREVARALLFDACPAEGCAWIVKVGALTSASATLREGLAAYDRARGLAGISDAIATAAQCPVPTKVPSTLSRERDALELACRTYDEALTAVAEVLPESSGLREAINDYRGIADARDEYRVELRELVAELSSLRFGNVASPAQLDGQIARYLALQAKYALALAGVELGDFHDLALEGTLMITREHRAALVRVLATLGARLAVPAPIKFEPGEANEPAAISMRSAPAPDPSDSSDPGTGDPGTGDPGTGDPGTGDPGTGDPGTGDPGTGEPEPPRPDPREPEPPRPDPRDPEPPRPDPSDPEPPRPDPRDPEPPDPAPKPPARPTPPDDPATGDRRLLQALGRSLVPVFGETWLALQDQRRKAERSALLLSAELERIQIDAMTRRLAFAEDRIWLELATIETQLLALLRLRLRLDADWIPANRQATGELDEADRLRIELELAEAALALAEVELGKAVDRATKGAGKGSGVNRQLVGDAKHEVGEAQAGVDAASDAYHSQLAKHGAALCRRSGTVAQTYEREPACVDPIERLVGLHAELVGVSLPRLESLERSVAQRFDEATLVRDEAGLEIRVTYIAASVAALQQFTAGGLEPRDVAAIVGAVVGIGLGAAITAGIYIP